jgi:hypothetical protein
VEVEAPSEAIGKQVSDEIPRLIKDEILPKLEKLFDRWDWPNDAVSFQNVMFDLGSVEPSRIEVELEGKLMGKMNNLLANLPGQRVGVTEPIDFMGNMEPDAGYAGDDSEKQVSVSITSLENKRMHAFIHFLRHGTRSWDFPEGAGFDRSFLEIVAESDLLIRQKLSAIFLEDQQAIRRLCRQFDADFIREIVKVLLVPEQFHVIHKWEVRLRKEPVPVPVVHDDYSVFWRSVARLVLGNQEIPVSGLQSWLHRYFAKDPSGISVPFEEKERFLKGLDAAAYEEINFPESSVGTEKQQKQVSGTAIKGPDEIDEEGLFVQNAGLILLHPYLESFFGEIELLENGDFRDRQCRETAVHLLHYLAVKEVFTPEYDLVFEKYLCGIPADEPIQRFLILPDPMKQECDQLLRAVIRNWNKLKETSPDGLREGFLRRKGKLTHDAFGSRLRLEHMAHDVLLSFLPWGISVVRLPWMAEILSVEWPDSI